MSRVLETLISLYIYTNLTSSIITLYLELFLKYLSLILTIFLN